MTLENSARAPAEVHRNSFFTDVSYFTLVDGGAGQLGSSNGSFRRVGMIGWTRGSVISGIWRDCEPAASLARRPAPGASALPAMRVREMRVRQPSVPRRRSERAVKQFPLIAMRPGLVAL